MPRKSSSGVGVVSAALSGTDRAGTKRGIKCIGAEPARIKRASPAIAEASADSAEQTKRRRSKEMLSARARIWCAGRDF